MTLDRYLVRQFLPIFAIALSMFMMLVLLIDLFVNLARYLNNEAVIRDIILVSLYYLPKCLSYAMPIALLFASAYTLGDLYTRNELTTVFTSGIPFWRFGVSLVIIGLGASLFSFYFDDLVVIPTLKMKNELSRTLLHTQFMDNNSDIVIKAKGGLVIYSVDYYDISSESLNGISIIEKDETGTFISLVRSPRAVWTGEYWTFTSPLIYEWQDGFLRSHLLADTSAYDEVPDTFRRSSVSAGDLRAGQAALLVKDLRDAGLPYISAQADYYHRYSFSAVPFIVIILSITMGGRFRKNILLMSLLTSLGTAVVYYVMEMISMMSARLGIIPPLAGAWIPVGFFSVIGVLLLRFSRT
ncbi:membrane protein [Spirochaetia bacterium]|nr:membrane protein [Spirochaetia bacterium]